MSDPLTSATTSTLWTPKSLTRRQGRSQRAMQCLVASEPVRIAVRLKKVIRNHLEIAADEQEMPEVRSEAAKVAYGGIDRLLDILQYPKRPAAKGGDGKTIDIAKLLDITPHVTPGPGSGPA